MSRQRVRTALRLALVLLSLAPPAVSGRANQMEPGAVEKEAREALARFDAAWKDYTNDPNYGDPRWTLKMETLVRLARVGPAAVPLLEEAAKEGSSWKPHTRNLAADLLAIVRSPEPLGAALASYDLTTMDTAVVGKPAPDFSLADASGETYRLSQFRGNKAVLLTFIIQDI